jgi:MOSC domain-containing protein YiiM
VAGDDRERWAQAGDQLYVDLDLSYANVPPGTRLQVGEAVIEVSPEPHLGCGKFLKRFGLDAQKLVNSAVGRELNMRGINTTIITGGVVRTGDPIVKLEP